MQRLILVRHAEAQTRAGGQRDIERPLSAQGALQAAALGRAVAAAGMKPDRALVSSAVRTRQTWEAMQPAFPAAHLRLEPRLFNAAAGEIVRLLEEVDGRTVMVVAHNPGVALYAAHLAAQSGAAEAAQTISASFAPATAAVFACAGAAPTFERLFRAAEYGPHYGAEA